MNLPARRQPFPWSLLYGTFVGASLATLTFLLLAPHADGRTSSPSVPAQLEALRHEISSLRIEVGELRRRVDERAPTTARR